MKSLMFWLFFFLCAFSNYIILLIYEDKKVYTLSVKYKAQISLDVIPGEPEEY